jgi:hypothetical protein
MICSNNQQTARLFYNIFVMKFKEGQQVSSIILTDNVLLKMNRQWLMDKCKLHHVRLPAGGLYTLRVKQMCFFLQ